MNGRGPRRILGPPRFHPIRPPRARARRSLPGPTSSKSDWNRCHDIEGHERILRLVQESWNEEERLLMDFLAGVFISAGGIGTIIAVLGVCVFLVYVVIPLFQSADVEDAQLLERVTQGQPPLYAAVDEFQAMGWRIYPDGTLRVFMVNDGRILAEKKFFEGKTITASSFHRPGRGRRLRVRGWVHPLRPVRFQDRVHGELGHIRRNPQSHLKGTSGRGGPHGRGDRSAHARRPVSRPNPRGHDPG